MKRITSNDELIVGKWYWTRLHGYSCGYRALQVIRRSEYKTFHNGMCRDPENDQALANYEIYGPIPEPTP